MPRAMLSLLLVLLSLLPLVGCASSHSQESYVLVTLKSGDRAAEKTPEERRSIQEQHLANIRRLADEGTLVVAGPYGQVNHDPTSRGIFIFDVPTVEQAVTLTNTDPAVIAGVLTMHTETLRTDADFAAAVQAERDRQAALSAEGKTRSMGEGMRTYVILRTPDYWRSRAVLERLLPPNVTIVDAVVGVNEGFFILDATDAATVRGWLGKSYDEVGPCTMDEWYSTDMLVKARTPIDA